ncbi:RecX family transcriptional regulator [Mucilaginibacter hurinus]|uniref:Regulatory protein RecX n=1 Tax=Mucilaginibacter hurinus TaxID=2201324 RepID=A0A367GNV0_9SPHI|nr:regulatory protein RecX [Mucilaginibacter hurinus]RCH55157.1 RecX family transcriptional regulator [Mucilaginibacter hurinus]
MEPTKTIKITDENTAMRKAEHYCAYQERSQQEVRNKLYEWGVVGRIVETVISRLITDNFLNEERFARTYARSKFNQKQWGRIKIKQGLKLKQVPDVLIKKALLGIDAEDYWQVLHTLINKKAPLVKEKDPFKRRYKLQQYAMSRGFENDLIAEVLKASEL